MPHPPRLVPWRVAIPLTTTAAVAGAGIGFLVVSLLVNPARVGDAEAGASSSPAVASSPPAAAASPAQAPDAASSAGGDAAPPAPRGDAGEAASDAGPPPDELTSDAGLKPYESYLYVRSSAQADVWVHGIKIGATNQKLKLPCTKGLRFTRLGKDPGPAWISKAVSIKIPCGSVTQLELEPEANPKPRVAGDSDNPY